MILPRILRPFTNCSSLGREQLRRMAGNCCFSESKKRSAMTKRDVLRKRASINLLDLDIRWQFDPQQETTGWLPNFGGCRETFFDDTKSQFSPLPVERRKKSRWLSKRPVSRYRRKATSNTVLLNAYLAGISGEQTGSHRDQVNKLQPGALARLSWRSWLRKLRWNQRHKHGSV